MADMIDRMRRNPAGDWTIADVVRACRQAQVRCEPPSGGGSHYKVSHPSRKDILTVPARRPIKAIYIRNLVRFLEAVEAENGGA